MHFEGRAGDKKLYWFRVHQNVLTLPQALTYYMPWISGFKYSLVLEVDPVGVFGKDFTWA